MRFPGSHGHHSNPVPPSVRSNVETHPGVNRVKVQQWKKMIKQMNVERTTRRRSEELWRRVILVLSSVRWGVCWNSVKIPSSFLFAGTSVWGPFQDISPGSFLVTHTHRDTHRHVQTHAHSQNSLPHWPNSTSKHKWNINIQCPGKHTTLILTNTAQPYSCPLRPLKQFKCQNFGVRTTKQLSGILLSRNVLLCGLCVRKGKQPNDMLLLWKIKYFEVIKKQLFVCCRFKIYIYLIFFFRTQFILA